jgi:hypothetical protein
MTANRALRFMSDFRAADRRGTMSSKEKQQDALSGVPLFTLLFLMF